MYVSGMYDDAHVVGYVVIVDVVVDVDGDNVIVDDDGCDACGVGASYVGRHGGTGEVATACIWRTRTHTLRI